MGRYDTRADPSGMGTSPQPAKAPERTGLGRWMRRTSDECAGAAQAFAPEPVHDLRVALRRCRLLADTMMALDPHPDWRAMRKCARRLFRRLGRLRDAQVMREWIERLAPAEDAVRARLVAELTAQEQQHGAEARAALDRFPGARWRRWSRSLPRRMGRLPAEGPALQHLALERWQEAHDLHRRALRRRSQKGWHELRIGLKHFRYTVENLLPSRSEWLAELKNLQDLLGEVHDLDELRARYFTRRRRWDEEARGAWLGRIAREREERLRAYRRRMSGKNAPWASWRAALPHGADLEAAALAKLRAWARFLHPRGVPSERVARLALELFDALAALERPRQRDVRRWRRILHAAALLHDVGLAQRRRGHHKASYRLIRRLPAPLGWTAEDVRRTALVARYHRGAEPQETHPGFGRLSAKARHRVRWLAGLLRLADGLAQAEAGGVRAVRVDVDAGGDPLTIWARGLREDVSAAALLGGRKHLLEATLGRPILLRPWTPRRIGRGQKPGALFPQQAQGAGGQNPEQQAAGR